jgi:hypothetical protein
MKGVVPVRIHDLSRQDGRFDWNRMRLSGFEHQHVETGVAQVERAREPGRAAPNDADIETFVQCLPTRKRQAILPGDEIQSADPGCGTAELRHSNSRSATGSGVNGRTCHSTPPPLREKLPAELTCLFPGANSLRGM